MYFSICIDKHVYLCVCIYHNDLSLVLLANCKQEGIFKSIQRKIRREEREKEAILDIVRILIFCNILLSIIANLSRAENNATHPLNQKELSSQNIYDSLNDSEISDLQTGNYIHYRTI